MSYVHSISAGNYHNLYISQLDGVVYGFGSNSNGQLGDSGVINCLNRSAIPTPLTLLKNIVSISGGGGYVLAENGLLEADEPSGFSGFVTSDGHLYMCGANSNNQMGNLNITATSTPTLITDELVESISCGGVYSVRLLKNGQVKVSGKVYETLDYDELTLLRYANNTPVTGVKQIACGTYHFACLLHDGRILSVGLNDNGQLGNYSLTNSNTPVLAVYPTKNDDGVNYDIVDDAVYISCGLKHTLAITKSGNVIAFGDNTYGQVGTNNPLECYAVIHDMGMRAISVHAGGFQSFIIMSDGTIQIAGRNNKGQLGNNSLINVSSFTPLSLPEKVADIACGFEHTLFLLLNGTLRVCGANTYYQSNSEIEELLIRIPTLVSNASYLSTRNIFYEGPTGPTGPRGEIGPTGPTGIMGATGPQGVIGVSPFTLHSSGYAYFNNDVSLAGDLINRNLENNARLELRTNDLDESENSVLNYNFLKMYSENDSNHLLFNASGYNVEYYPDGTIKTPGVYWTLRQKAFLNTHDVLHIHNGNIGMGGVTHPKNKFSLGADVATNLDGIHLSNDYSLIVGKNNANYLRMGWNSNPDGTEIGTLESKNMLYINTNNYGLNINTSETYPSKVLLIGQDTSIVSDTPRLFFNAYNDPSNMLRNANNGYASYMRLVPSTGNLSIVMSDLADKGESLEFEKERIVIQYDKVYVGKSTDKVYLATNINESFTLEVSLDEENKSILKSTNDMKLDAPNVLVHTLTVNNGYADSMYSRTLNVTSGANITYLEASTIKSVDINAQNISSSNILTSTLTTDTATIEEKLTSYETYSQYNTLLNITSENTTITNILTVGNSVLTNNNLKITSIESTNVFVDSLTRTNTLEVKDTANILNLSASLVIMDNVTTRNTLHVGGNTTLVDNVHCSNSLHVTKDFILEGNMTGTTINCTDIRSRNIYSNDINCVGSITLEGIGNITSPGNINITGNLQCNKATVATLSVSGKIQENGQDLIPRGAIILWSGSLPPEGWALCDGSSPGIPDLRGRFILGYNPSIAETDETGMARKGFNSVGENGGHIRHTLTINEMPTHSHGISDPGHVHSEWVTDRKFVTAVVNDDKNMAPISGPPYQKNTESKGTNLTVLNEGYGDSFDMTPPYYVLAYIFKL
jgi:microcystin-dependent protein